MYHLILMVAYTWPFVNHSKPAVELPAALSVEVVALQCANNENKPVQ